jgi:hypothetical protein
MYLLQSWVGNWFETGFLRLWRLREESGSIVFTSRGFLADPVFPGTPTSLLSRIPDLSSILPQRLISGMLGLESVVCLFGRDPR